MPVSAVPDVPVPAASDSPLRGEAMAREEHVPVLYICPRSFPAVFFQKKLQLPCCQRAERFEDVTDATRPREKADRVQSRRAKGVDLHCLWDCARDHIALMN